MGSQRYIPIMEKLTLTSIQALNQDWIAAALARYLSLKLGIPCEFVADLPWQERAVPWDHSAGFLKPARGEVNMHVQFFTAEVRDGAIIPDDDVALREGTRLTVLARGLQRGELTDAEEAEWLESLAEPDDKEMREAQAMLEAEELLADEMAHRLDP